MPVMSSPQNATPPDVGLIWPRIELNSVVLPEPFGPMLAAAIVLLLPEWLRFLKDWYLVMFGFAIVA